MCFGYFFQVFDHEMTPTKLKAINADNLVAEAEYSSRKATHAVRIILFAALIRLVCSYSYIDEKGAHLLKMQM